MVDNSAVFRAMMADMENAVNQTVRKFCADLAVELRIRTPKDTHLASVNWIWDTQPRNQTVQVPNLKPGQIVPDTDFQAGLQRLKSWTIRMGELFMTNAVDYIGQKDPRGVDGLDAGYSKKAPRDFVRMCVEKVVKRYQ